MNPYALDQQNYANAIAKYQHLARGYKSDVNAYNKSVADYNTAATNFNNSFYLDASQQKAGMINGQWTTNTPTDKTGYGLYQDPNDPTLRVLRKPTSTTDETANYRVISMGGRGGAPTPAVFVNGGWKPVRDLATLGYVTPDVRGWQSGTAQTIQRANFDAAPTAPAAFTQTAPTAPEAPTGTLAQEQGTAGNSQALAANERGGLIADVIRGRGVR